MPLNLSIAGYYFFSLLVLTMLSTFNAVLVLRIHHRKVFLKELQSRVWFFDQGRSRRCCSNLSSSGGHVSAKFAWPNENLKRIDKINWRDQVDGWHDPVQLLHDLDDQEDLAWQRTQAGWSADKASRDKCEINSILYISFLIDPLHPHSNQQ